MENTNNREHHTRPPKRKKTSFGKKPENSSSMRKGSKVLNSFLKIQPPMKVYNLRISETEHNNRKRNFPRKKRRPPPRTGSNVERNRGERERKGKVKPANASPDDGTLALVLLLGEDPLDHSSGGAEIGLRHGAPDQSRAGRGETMEQ